MQITKASCIGLVSKSRESFVEWKQTALDFRLEKMRKLSDELSKQKRVLALTISTEEGKPFTEALMEVEGCLGLLDFYVNHAKKTLRIQTLQSPIHGTLAFAKPEPVGVVLVISPWNFPLETPLWSICPALIAGNTVIVKPSEHSEKTSKKLEKILSKNFPKGVVSFVYGDGKIGSMLVGSGVNKIVFTGSTKTGKDVLRNAAESITPVVLELGGKDVAIVCSDADIFLAAKGIVWGAFNNAGQVCTSVERVFVHKKIAKKFLERLVFETRALKKGKDIRSLINKQQYETVKLQVEDALSNGAIILHQGQNDTEPNYFPPTILTNVKLSMKIMQEETFGPVIPISIVESEKQAVKLANRNIYGLGASVWSKNFKKAERIAGELDVGIVWINDVNVVFHSCPWSGRKQSGYGVELSEAGLLEFVNFKTLIVNNAGSKRGYWFPYKLDPSFPQK